MFFLVYSRNLPQRLNYGRIPLLRACEWLSLVAAEPLVVGTVGADFVEDLVKTGAQLVVALADGKAVVFRLQDTGHFAQVEVGGGLLSQEVLVDGLVVDDGLAALVVEFKEGFTRRIEGAYFGALDRT